MGAAELWHRQFSREALGYLALPALYAGLMAAGVFVASPALVLLSALLVGVLLLQARAAGAAARVAARSPAPPKVALAPRKALDAADAAFLRQVDYTVVTGALGYLVFLGALDLHVRVLASGQASSTALLAGALSSIALIVGGREVARFAAWRRVEFLQAGHLPGLRASGPTPRAYLEWRAGVEAEVSPPYGRGSSTQNTEPLA